MTLSTPPRCPGMPRLPIWAIRRARFTGRTTPRLEGTARSARCCVGPRRRATSAPNPKMLLIFVLSATSRGRSTGRTRLGSMDDRDVITGDAGKLLHELDHRMAAPSTQVHDGGLLRCAVHRSVQRHRDEPGGRVRDVDVVPPRVNVTQAERPLSSPQLHHHLRDHVRVRVTCADDVEEPDDDRSKAHASRAVAHEVLGVELRKAIHVERADRADSSCAVSSGAYTAAVEAKTKRHPGRQAVSRFTVPEHVDGRCLRRHMLALRYEVHCGQVDRRVGPKVMRGHGASTCAIAQIGRVTPEETVFAWAEAPRAESKTVDRREHRGEAQGRAHHLHAHKAVRPVTTIRTFRRPFPEHQSRCW